MAHICEWLTEKVDSYSTRLNPEPKDEPEEVKPYNLPHCTAQDIKLSTNL